jgi:hypothetical protein
MKNSQQLLLTILPPTGNTSKVARTFLEVFSCRVALFICTRYE